MSWPGVPPEVERFIVDHIDSVNALEVLLLLQRLAPAELSAEAVGRELRVDAGWASTALRELTERGLLSARAQSAPVYGYAPRTPELAAGAAALLKAYGERPVQVVGLIFAKPNPNVRGFAEAFRLRKD